MPPLGPGSVGHALMSRLLVNLGALRVGRVETILAPRHVALAGFLDDCGFAPSQRLIFARAVTPAAR
jgi:hypothetical protein